MITLGIRKVETVSACIFKDGRLLAAVRGECLTRVKMGVIKNLTLSQKTWGIQNKSNVVHAQFSK